MSLLGNDKKSILSGLKRKLSFDNRCIGCDEDLGDCNPRQYCCKTYCPILEKKNEDETFLLQSLAVSNEEIPKSGLISIIHQNDVVGYFDRKYCDINGPIELRMVLHLMFTRILELNTKMSSISFKTCLSVDKNNHKKQLKLEMLNIRIKTAYNTLRDQYISLKRCYNYILKFNGLCIDQDLPQCFCYESKCKQCAYTKHMSRKLPDAEINSLDSALRSRPRASIQI